MPVNPIKEAQAALVSRLRAHARIESEGHRIDLSAAANEIETLGELVIIEESYFSDRLQAGVSEFIYRFFSREGSHYEPQLMTTISHDSLGSGDHYFTMNGHTPLLKLELTVRAKRTRVPNA